MADKTHIQWTDATWNPITGCSVVSPGCTNCYAMQLAGTRLKHHPSRAGLTRVVNGKHVWTGEIRFNADWLTQPLKWTKPRRVFVGAHTDLFHPNVSDNWLDQIFAVMALTPQHIYQILTKRPERMRSYMIDMYDRRTSIASTAAYIGGGKNPDHVFDGVLALLDGPLFNVWLGVSVDDQARADARIPDLLNTPAALRWISAEPLLGSIDPSRICILSKQAGSHRAGVHINALTGRYVESGRPYIGDWDIDQPYPSDAPILKLDWVVVGGESGPNARPMHPEWVRSLRDQCATAGVPFFLKQWGEWAPVCEMTDDIINRCYYPAPKNRPDATRRERLPSIVLHIDGAKFAGNARFEFGACAAGKGAMTMFPIGKVSAGDRLNGVQHHNWPEMKP